MSSVLFVSYSGAFGGAERVLLEAAAALDGTALLACPPGPLASAAAAVGLTTVRLPARGLRVRGDAHHRLDAATALAAHALEIRRLARDVDPDLIVGWGMRSGIAALAIPFRTPFAFAHHDFLPSPDVAAIVRLVARRAGLVTVPSRAVRADLDPRGKLGERVRIIAPGVDPEHFAGLGPLPAEPSALLLGALAPWKRPDLALEMIARARDELPRLSLNVVGAPVTDDEPLVNELRERANHDDLRGAVSFPGPAIDAREPLELAACLVHCAPREPFGIAIVEAMASGRPVVVPDAAGPREIVTKSCGELYAPGDARAGARALVRILADPDRAREMGAAGRSRAQRMFTAGQTRRGFRDALSALRRPPAWALDTPALTLLTVSHNSAAELTRLIASRDAHLPQATVIVVDSGSTDQSVAVAESQPNVRVIALAENLGFGRACNRGLSEVITPVTALLNPDVELIDDSLLALAHEALRGDRPERLLAPLTLSLDGTRQETAHPVPASWADLTRAVVPPALAPGPALAPWRARRPRRVGWAVGAALVARTATLSELGPFDESIFMYGEDLDLGLRATAAGISTWFWPAGRVLHAGAHASDRAFGGEPFLRLAQARQETVARRLGPRRAQLDRLSQTVTFASRIALKAALRRPARRERMQLAALRGLAPPA